MAEDLQNRVVFEVKEADGRVSEIEANKETLAAKSKIFHAMFYGPLAEKSPSVTIEDVQGSALAQLVSYCDGDEIIFETEDEAIHVAYAAEKYLLQDLLDISLDFLFTNVTSENAIRMFEFNLVMDSHLAIPIVNVITTNLRIISQQTCFLNLPKKSLTILVKHIHLSVDALVLFQALYEWCRNICENEGNPCNKQHIRKEMDMFLPYIAFLQIPVALFVSKVLSTKLLEDSEVLDILVNLDSGGKLKGRLPIWCSHRCFIVVDCIKSYNVTWRDTKSLTLSKPFKSRFTVSAEAHLFSFSVSYTNNNISEVTLKAVILKDFKEEIVLGMISVKKTLSNDSLSADFNLKYPLLVLPNTLYTLEIRLDCPRTAQVEINAPRYYNPRNEFPYRGRKGNKFVLEYDNEFMAPRKICFKFWNSTYARRVV